MRIKKSSYKDGLLKKALLSPVRISLPEYNDSRVVSASKKLSQIGFETVESDQLKVNKEKYIELISKKKFTNNWSLDMKNNFLNSSLNLSLAALDNNDIDCVVAGAEHSSAEVLRSTIRVIGVDKKAKWISSAFFMISPDNKYGYTYADCGVIPDPNSEQLCNIGYESSKLHRLLSNEEPNVAFLSFSSKGSAEHYKVKKIQEAVKLFKKKYPSINVDGEIQFDAAINDNICKQKIGNSPLKGLSNVFIFPDLDSANIAYKITEHLAGFQALGPLLMGINKPVHDLSRGCSIDDIIYVSAIAAIQKNRSNQ